MNLDPSFVARVLSDFTPGAAGVWTIALMVAGWIAREWRETRKLSAEDRQARREGYAFQVGELTKDNRALREEIATSRREHESYRKLCHEENDQLRQHVVALENLVAGLQCQLATAAVTVARQIGAGVLGSALNDVDPDPADMPAHLKDSKI